MKRTRLCWSALAAITILISGCSKSERTSPPASEPAAAQPGAVGTGGAGANVKTDEDFVRDVAIKNLMAIELSRQALDRSANPQIKAFARKVIDDHDAAGDKLESAVSRQPIEWPAQLDERHRRVADELSTKQGASFDRNYLKAVIDSQQDLAAKLESRLDV